MPRPLLIFSQSDYLIQILIPVHILNYTQCRSRSVGFFRNQLIWIHTVCKSRVYPVSAGQGLITKLIGETLLKSTHRCFYGQLEKYILLNMSIGRTNILQGSWTAESLRKHAYSNILKIFTTKNWKFSDKNSNTFHISAQNIDCGYSLEPLRRGGSNEYPQSMLLSRNKKNNAYPCKPQFYYIKVGFKGVKII